MAIKPNNNGISRILSFPSLTLSNDHNFILTIAINATIPNFVSSFFSSKTIDAHRLILIKIAIQNVNIKIFEQG